MSNLCDFQAQFDFTEEKIEIPSRSQTSAKTEIRKPTPPAKGPFLYQMKALNKELKTEIHIKSVQKSEVQLKTTQKKFIPIQSVLPSIKINRTSKSVKHTNYTKRTTRSQFPLNKKKSFLTNPERISTFFRFQNYYLQGIK